MFKKPYFSKESEVASAKPTQCQETARMVESPAGITTLPTANPLRNHGNKTVPLSQLLLKHSLINMNPISLQNSHCIFQSFHAKRTALPRTVPQNTERGTTTLGLRRQVCSEVNKTLAPLQMTICFVFCSIKSTGSPWEQAGEAVEVWGPTL